VGKFGSAHKAIKAVEQKKDAFLHPCYLTIASILLEIDFNLAKAVSNKHTLERSAKKIVEKLKKDIF
jgi:hypothetical protein